LSWRERGRSKYQSDNLHEAPEGEEDSEEHFEGWVGDAIRGRCWVAMCCVIAREMVIGAVNRNAKGSLAG